MEKRKMLQLLRNIFFMVMVFPFGLQTVNAQTNSQAPFPSVKIGDQEWMSLNWDYETPKSFFYNNDSTIDSKYGRLYYYSNAVAACPPGWRLPTMDDWWKLINRLGGINMAGTALLAQNDTSLQLLAGGYKSGNLNEGEVLFGFLDTYAFYWTSTPDGDQTAYAIQITKKTGAIDITSYRRANGFSVRYIKND